MCLKIHTLLKACDFTDVQWGKKLRHNSILEHIFGQSIKHYIVQQIQKYEG